MGETPDGERFGMNYTVADVAVALDSVSQMCDGGATVVFHKDGGWVERPNGDRTIFKRDRDTYVREVWVPIDPRAAEEKNPPFTGQTQS